MTKRTIYGTMWGVILTPVFYAISIFLGIISGLPTGLSIAAAITAGGTTGIIIGSNETAPFPASIAGGFMLATFFVILSSFSGTSLNSLTQFIHDFLVGGTAGAICSVFVHMIPFD